MTASPHLVSARPTPVKLRGWHGLELRHHPPHHLTLWTEVEKGHCLEENTDGGEDVGLPTRLNHGMPVIDDVAHVEVFGFTGLVRGDGVGEVTHESQVLCPKHPPRRRSADLVVEILSSPQSVLRSNSATT